MAKLSRIEVILLMFLAILFGAVFLFAFLSVIYGYYLIQIGLPQIVISIAILLFALAALLKVSWHIVSY
ncbi:MAG TPA: hypothetical protein VFF28_05760 [Candidatus Nanoarchaeia archaeon]|nr:hypothetical protein [Candidatus Nanoarchaeia archaeon]